MCLAPLSETSRRQDEEYEAPANGALLQVRALTRCGGVAPIAIRSGCDNPRHAVHARCAKDWLYSATLKNDALKALPPLPKLAETRPRPLCRAQLAVPRRALRPRNVGAGACAV